jgi:CHAD domain-containing protein
MPARPPSVVFTVGPEVDLSRLTRWLPGLAPAGPVRSSDKTLYDTFDGRLRRRGLTMWRVGPASRAVFELEGFAGPVPTTGSSAPGGGLLAADLPENVAGQRIREAIAERAVLPRVRVRGRRLPLKVCDREAKTVVRLLLDEPEVIRRGQAPIVLDRRLHVSGVLGYRRELDRVLASLERRLAETDRTTADDAMIAAGLDPRGFPSDVAVQLTPSMRADQATSLICRRLAEVVEGNLPGVIDDIDPEFLHDFRVAVRRTRSVVKEMAPVLSPEVLGPARDDLKWIQEISGPTRDLDVLLMAWPSMAQPVPASMQADLGPMVSMLRDHRRAAFSELSRHLRSRRFAAAWGRWRDVVDAGRFEGGAAGTPAVDLAGRRVISVYKGMVAMGSAINDDSPAEALHDLRKKGKELRYLFELFGSLWPPEVVKPMVSALKGLQDELGHFQDDEIQVGELRRLAPSVVAAPGGTDTLIALGFVIDGLANRQAQARAAFASRFAAFASAPTRRVMSVFGSSKARS